MKSRRVLRKTLIIIGLVCAWELVSLAVHSKLIMASPLETISAFFEMAKTGEFYTTILFSTYRVLLGFFIACALSIVFGTLAYRFSLIKDILQPIILLMKSIPVASFIIIALLWMGSRNLSIFIVVLVALPVLYTQLLSGLENTPGKYLELADVFGFSFSVRVRAIYLPAIREGFLAASSLAVGMSFKAGIAAELISGVGGSIGDKIYRAKLYFSTGELFAWTGVIVALSFVCEKLVVAIFKAVFNGLSGEGAFEETPKSYARGNIKSAEDKEDKENESGVSLSLKNVTKSYEKTGQLFDISLDSHSPEIIAVCGPSGEGKTTLLHILAGLVEPDSGIVRTPKRKSMVFQDTRLIEHLSAAANVRCALSCTLKTSQNMDVNHALSDLLPKECLAKPVRELSGGERRRVELVRAMLADSKLVLLDEPFTGTDEETKERAMAFIRKYHKERVIVCTAHEVDEVMRLKPQKKVEMERKLI